MVILENLQNYDIATQKDLLLVVLRYIPLSLLVGDFFANRIYLPLTIVANYPWMAYSFAALNYLIRADVSLIVKLPELNYFNIETYCSCVAWGLPGAISLAVYFAIRIKFWYIDEGDIVFNFSAWAKQANERMDWIENDGVREEDNFQFLVEGGDDIETTADGKAKKRQAR